MTKPKKMGRPTLPAKEKLSRVYCIRLRPEEDRDLLKAVAASGKSTSDWIRDTLMAAARGEQEK